jgi:hypothetical protein
MPNKVNDWGDHSDLYDHEIMAIMKIGMELEREFGRKRNTEENYDELTKRAVQALYELGFLAHVDLAPIMEGKPPILSILNRVSGSIEHTEGLDHERKRWEVLAANERGEQIRGQKDSKYKG